MSNHQTDAIFEIYSIKSIIDIIFKQILTTIEKLQLLIESRAHRLVNWVWHIWLKWVTFEMATKSQP